MLDDGTPPMNCLQQEGKNLNALSPLLISVVTVTRNCATTLPTCLASVASQAYAHREHVVIDGASTDDTVGLLRIKADQIARWVSEPDNGIYDALNKGIKLSVGDVIGFLHADDVFADHEVLNKVSAAFAVDRHLSAIFGDLQYVRKDDVSKVVRYWRSTPFTPRRLTWGWMPPHPTLYVRREWYERLGGFDDSLSISADYDFILRLFSQPGFKAAYLPHVLVKMRVGGASNRSLANIVLKSREDLHALRRSRVGGLGALAMKNVCKLPQFFG
jgi:glycosyltransferase involved in cell wall biosynthesis